MRVDRRRGAAALVGRFLFRRNGRTGRALFISADEVKGYLFSARVHRSLLGRSVNASV